MMVFYHRKLLDLSKPKDDDSKPNPKPNPKPCGDDCNKSHTQTPTHHYFALGILTAFFLITFFICLAYYAYRRRLLRRNPIAAQPRQPVAENGFFIDRLQVPAEDHHVWHIRTVGLSESAINSIAEFKFKKRGEVSFGNGDCPVCLSEFEEDERLRLMPECDHAFHLTCIDNWLRSHKNCPVCRAPVIVNFDGDRSDVSDEASSSGSGFGDGQIGTEEGGSGREVGVWSGKFRVVSDLSAYGRVRVVHHQPVVNKVKRSISMS